MLKIKKRVFTITKGAAQAKTSSSICHTAFTLAEVLITLGVIGIVAAMTLPTVINNIKNKEHEAKFKQAYSLIYQAVLMMGNDDPQLWQTYCRSGEESKRLFVKDFAKQFQTTGEFDHTITSKRDLQLLGYKQKHFYAAQKGKKKFNTDSHDSGAFVAKNGMIVFSSGCWWAALDFVVDTNGHKGPNKFGYDVFYFQIAKNNQLLPSSINSSFTNEYAQGLGCCSFDGSTADGGNCDGSEGGSFGGVWTDNGSACSKFALMDSFPGDESKSYWKNLPTP